MAKIIGVYCYFPLFSLWLIAPISMFFYKICLNGYCEQGPIYSPYYSEKFEK